MQVNLSVNELSKITGVSSRNIRYYDSIGLFMPTGIFDNGYRYYSLDKIEELRMINYFRHSGIPIREIKKHMDNRNLVEYEKMIDKQISFLSEELERIESTKARLENLAGSIDYIKNLPPLNQVFIEKSPKLSVIRHMKKTQTPMEWERELLRFGKDLPPSLMIGETGFFVDILKENRESTEFEGMFLFANDPFTKRSSHVEYVDEGYFLTMYFKGDHEDAVDKYPILKAYAKDNGLKLKNYAMERTLVDHFITDNHELYITEIKIPFEKE